LTCSRLCDAAEKKAQLGCGWAEFGAAAGRIFESSLLPVATARRVY
jgi:hypothetical protein